MIISLSGYTATRDLLAAAVGFGAGALNNLSGRSLSWPSEPTGSATLSPDHGGAAVPAPGHPDPQQATDDQAASLVWPAPPPAVPDHVHPLFRILGPLEVCPHGPVAPPARLEPLQRRLLAVLLAPPGTRWPREALAGALWKGLRPPAARDTIRVTIYRLRLALGGDATRLACTWGGYQFTAQPAETDAGHLASLAARGRAAWYRGDAAAAARLLGQAARLWRTPALADVPRTQAFASYRGRLAREYRDALSLYIDARLRLGAGREVIPVLRSVLAADPDSEHSWAQIITALTQTGDRPGAAAAYRAACAAIARAYQRPPGPELTEVARRVLG